MNECCICYEKKSIVSLSCKHSVCLFCLIKLNKTKCPYCRCDLSKDLPKEILEIIKANKNNDINNSQDINQYYYNWTGVNLNHISYDFYTNSIWRRNDLIRFGQFTRDWEFKNPASVGDETKTLYPIPLIALLSNPNLQQNPGY